jgi:hypothetical protein
MMMGIVVVRGERPRFPRQKKSAGLKEKERLKSESAECERKKRRICAFLPFAALHWKPSSRAQNQGEKQGS